MPNPFSTDPVCSIFEVIFVGDRSLFLHFWGSFFHLQVIVFKPIQDVTETDVFTL